jgi:hypothetical protein
MPSPPASPGERGSQIGRRAGYLLLGLLVSAFTAVCTLEIIGQVWFPRVESAQGDCRAGIRQLVQALGRARSVAATVRNGSEAGAAVAEFRKSLEPEWRGRATVGTVCEGDTEGLLVLKQIDQLRYAEEHAVRYEARNLSRLRREVERALQELGLAAADSPLLSPSTPPP